METFSHNCYEKEFCKTARAFCRKKWGGTVVRESGIGAAYGDESEGIAQVLGRELGPELVTELTDQLHSLLSQLEAPLLVKIATFKLEGLTDKEISLRIERKVRTVERKLAVIREIWTDYVR